MKKLNKAEQRQRIQELWVPQNITGVCEQLLEEGVSPRMVLHQAKPTLFRLAQGYHYDAKLFLNLVSVFWRYGMTEDEILALVDSAYSDEAFYFYLYKLAPKYGIHFHKTVIARHFMVKFVDYVHGHFELLTERFELGSDDMLDVLTHPDTLKILSESPDDFEVILKDYLDYDGFEYNINDIAERFIDAVGYNSEPIWLIEIMAILVDRGATVIDMDYFGERVLALKRAEHVNWDSQQQHFFESLLTENNVSPRIIAGLTNDVYGSY